MLIFVSGFILESPKIIAYWDDDYYQT